MPKMASGACKSGTQSGISALKVHSRRRRLSYSTNRHTRKRNLRHFRKLKNQTRSMPSKCGTLVAEHARPLTERTALPVDCFADCRRSIDRHSRSCEHKSIDFVAMGRAAKLVDNM